MTPMIDYNNSLLSLISSILKHYGAETRYATLPFIDGELKKGYKNVVLMVFDGMGTSIVEKHLPPDAFLRRNLKKTIKSVFPPTTTAATTTLITGLSPVAHGWLGWSLYFDELGYNVSIYPNTISGSGGEKAADYHVAERYLPFKSVFSKIEEATEGNVRAIPVSPFSESYKCNSVSEICETVKKLCGEAGRKYIYTYCIQPDFDMHDLGTGHEKIRAHMETINRETEDLCSELKDTLVILTADHGLIDTEWLYMDDYPGISDCLYRPPSLETRTISLFVKEEKRKEFEGLFLEYFGGYYMLFKKHSALKIFGPGDPHPRSPGFLGEYIAVATGDVSLAAARSLEHEAFKAAHAGLTEEEMHVPAIIITT